MLAQLVLPCNLVICEYPVLYNASNVAIDGRSTAARLPFGTATRNRSDVTFVEMLHPNDDRHPSPLDDGFARVVTVEKTENSQTVECFEGFGWAHACHVFELLFSANREHARMHSPLTRFDTIQLEACTLSVYLPVINAAPSPPLVLADWHNVESELFWRSRPLHGIRQRRW